MTNRPSLRVSFSLLLAGTSLLGACAGDPAADPVPSRRRATLDRAGLPLEKASATELSRFKDGDGLFEAIVRESDGLGPLYVRDSCSACHQGDARGPGLVHKMWAFAATSREAAAKLLPWGASERPFKSAGAQQALLAPSDAMVRTVARLPPAVFGRGYLEAIDEAELERVAARASERRGVVRGRPNRLAGGVIGRFGVKARIATLDAFTADALNGDMGITSPTLPNEPPGPEGLSDDRKAGLDFSAEQVTQLAEYVRLLEIPTRNHDDSMAAQLFERVGCADCHVPSLRTSARFHVEALADVDAPVYSDLLLHDMGEALADGQYEGVAGPREFRTAPLLGLRFQSAFLHDGSAHDVAEAIAAHGAKDSEGRASVERFQALSPSEQRRLERFVEGL